MPDKMRKIKLFEFNVKGFTHSRRIATSAIKNMIITIVLIRVAVFDGRPATPTFANIAVNPANTADPNA